MEAIDFREFIVPTVFLIIGFFLVLGAAKRRSRERKYKKGLLQKLSDYVAAKLGPLYTLSGCNVAQVNSRRINCAEEEVRSVAMAGNAKRHIYILYEYEYDVVVLAQSDEPVEHANILAHYHRASVMVSC